MTPIKFGTDGWRAIIGDDFISANIEKVIQAFCDWRREKFADQKQVVLGFDRRNQSEESAKLAAEILAGNGFQVELAQSYCPTPCVSWKVKVSDAFAGIMITASHNPWTWNGIKFKENYGGSASPEYTGFVEARLLENEKKGCPIRKMPFAEAQKKGLVTFFDPQKEYINQIKSLLDLPKICGSGLKILYDAMHGAGSNYLKAILGDQVDEMRNESPPTNATNPEPIEKYLPDFVAKMKTGKWDIGLTTDGDADRIGAVDEHGRFVSSHLIFALLLKHYVEDKGLNGTVVKSLSTTTMIDKLCKKYGIECVETPIGFKYICSELKTRDALMGGEESGGISFRPHVHERDGLLNGLMLVNMMAVRGKSLNQLCEELFAEFGSFAYARDDLHVTHEAIVRMKVGANDYSPHHGGKPPVSKNFADGFKYIFEDGSWLLIRTSGTEPLVRIYAESKSDAEVRALIDQGKKLVV